MPAPARADVVSGPPGQPCRFVPTTADPFATTRSGLVVGGPYVGDGTLTCRVYLPGPGDVPTSSTGGPLVAVGPVAVTYGTYPSWSYVSVCTEFTPTGGTTRYLHDPLGTGAGYWSTSPGECQLVPDGRIGDPADLFTCTCDPGWYDYYVCPYLSQDQDVYVGDVWVYDCPPYGPYEG
jgi:hypothetical protein